MTSHRWTMPVLRNMPAILFVLVFVLFSVLDPRFATITNFSNIASTSAFVGPLAVGMTIVLLTGGIDLSVGRHDVHHRRRRSACSCSRACPCWRPSARASWPARPGAASTPSSSPGSASCPSWPRWSRSPWAAASACCITESRTFILPKEMRYAASSYLGIPLPVIVFAIVVVAAVVFLRYTGMGRQTTPWATTSRRPARPA